MNKKVQGLPKKVPIADASTLPRSKIARSAATSKCKPIKGVNDAATPQAKPTAIDEDDPGNLMTR